MLGTMPENHCPMNAKPSPVRKPMNGMASMPHDGGSPNTIATSSGAQP